MRMMVFLLLMADLVATARPGDEGTPEFERASTLVKQLGHPRFALREAAGKQLVEMGGSAVAALQAGAKADDEEVRTRSIALLPQAKAAAWKRRSDAYLADTAGKQKHDLPLLAEWEKLIGKPDAGSRKLYAEMLRTNGELLDAAATNPKGTSKLLQDRSTSLLDRVRGQKGQVKAEVGELAALFFVEEVSAGPARSAGSRRRGPDRSSAPAQLLGNPSWTEALDAADTGPVVRKLLSLWGSTRPARDYVGNQQFALLAQRKPFPEAAPVLAALVKNKDTDLLSVRVVAVQALGKVGGKEAAAVLTDLMSDKSIVFGGQDEHQLGDSALAALIQMNGKKLDDFGLTNNFAIGFASGAGEEPVFIQIHGFRSADERTKAVQKWKAEASKADGKKDK
jgi:hypothetical protein